MDSQRWKRVKEVIDLASAANSFERAHEVVKQACGDDVELQREAIKLLQAEEEMGDFIDEPLWTFVHPFAESDIAEPEDFRAGSRVGPYRLESVLGRGGMGTVFLAVREDDYQQQVALKIVSWQVNSEQLMARFYNERQILAKLRHPGIAQLLDGGTTREGRPYLVMEYVEGQPIDAYCRQNRLGLSERLSLFRHVCELVHFAHRNLVVHRDLKPSNILVTSDGAPKLLDFGIAKLMVPTERTLDLTMEKGPVPMTPSCASPEQFLDEPITTACDIYSLGVLLYSLLTDKPPYQLEGKSFAAMVQVICWQDPERPSLAVLSDTDRRPEDVRTLAEGTSKEPRRMSSVQTTSSRDDAPRSHAVSQRRSRRLKGDLDAIALKALRKDPQERYDSAAEFGEDIERYLRDEPVRAHRGNWFYYWRKFAHRNKYRLLVAAVLVLLVIGYTAVLAMQFERIRQTSQRAKILNQFLEAVFRASAPNRSKGLTITARELLESGSELIGEGLQDDPEVHAQFLRTLAEVDAERGNLNEARELYQEALDIETMVHKDDHQHKISLVTDLASIAYDQSSYEESERLYREALAARKRLYGEDDLDIDIALNGLGSTLARQGRYEEAEEVFEASLKVRLERYPDRRHYKIATSLSTFGTAFFQQGLFAKAEIYLREALEIRRESRGLKHTETATSLHNLGRVLYNQGRLDEAESLFRQSLAVRRELLGEGNVSVANTERNLALVLLRKNEPEEALRLVQSAMGVLEEVYLAKDWRTAEARSILGACLSRLNRFAEADQDLREGYLTLRSILGADSVYTLSARDRLKTHYDAWGKPERWAEIIEISTGVEPSG